MKGQLTKYGVIAVALVVCCATVLGVGLAVSEAGPDDLKGDWDVIANTSSLKLSIIKQDAIGNISGTLGTQAIEGFYLKGVRRLVFARKSNGQPYQLYVAAVSSSGFNMAGTFLVWKSATTGVDYNFSATRDLGPK